MTLPVLYHTIGGSGDNDAMRCVGDHIRRLFDPNGWASYAAARIPPKLHGFPHLLWSAGGITSTEGEVQFDQWLHAKTAGLSWLANDAGFVKAIKPLTDAGTRVIAYVGHLTTNDKNFKPSPGRIDAVKRRITDSIAPFLDAGCEIAIDAAGPDGRGHLSHAEADQLTALGVTVWKEARPHRGQETWPYGIIGEQFYHRSDPSRYPDSAWALADWKPAHLIRSIEGTPAGAEPFSVPPAGETWDTMDKWGPPLCRAIVADGHIPAFGVDWILNRPDPLAWWKGVLNPAPAGS